MNFSGKGSNMLNRFAAMAVLCVLAVSPCLRADNNGQDQDTRPNGKGNRVKDPLPQFATPGGQAKRGNGISYHGGPVILGTTNGYYIWYGNWSGNSAISILTDLAKSIGGSPYFNINTTYYDGAGRNVTNSVSYINSVVDTYSRGTSLSDSDIQGIVSDAITKLGLPKDTNGVYFVLTSSDVNETSGFCTQYCGWHTYGTISGSNIKYAFIGNPARCPSACERLVRPARGRECRQMRLDVRDDLYGFERFTSEYATRFPRLPHPAELGKRRWRLLRPELLI